MQTLSKDAEQKVIAAVKRAVSLVDDSGLTPTDAIEKVAREESWGPHMTRFASHAYNTGRQTAQRESSKTALDKFAEFPLADADEVVGRIWPAQVKSASDLALDDVSTEYGRVPGWVASQAAAEKLTRVKEAAAQLGMVKAAEAAKPRSMSLSTAIDVDRRYKKAAEEVRHEAAAAYDQLLSCMGQLADYFKKAAADRLDFGFVEKVAEVYYGDAGLSLMDWVFKRNHMDKLKTARAADTVWGRGLAEAQFDRKPWNLIANCIKLAKDVRQAREGEAAVKDAMTKHANDVMRPFVSAPTAPQSTTGISWSLLPEVGADKAAENVFEIATSVPAAQELLDKAVGKKPTREDLINKQWEELDDPAHAAKLQQINTQTMLTELMNDEVIGSHPPEHVLQAYNDISRLTPRAAQQPGVMKSMLQRHLQGQVQPFEHGEALNIEKGLKETAEPPKEDPALKLKPTPSTILK